MNLGTDIYDEDYNDYLLKNEIINDFPKDNNNTDDCSNSEELKISINCNLKVDFDTKNKMIYLYPGKAQYFTVDVSKCCGDVIIKYKGSCPDNGICGNLGIYHIVQSGIIVETYCRLDKRKKDILNFIAIDKCTKECCDFVVVFSFNPCCCHK